MLLLGGNEHSVKVSSNSEMVRAGVLFENFGDYRELVLISILPKNQAAPIEMVISDFFRILKTFIAFVCLCHKSPKAKGKLCLLCRCHGNGHWKF